MRNSIKIKKACRRTACYHIKHKYPYDKLCHVPSVFNRFLIIFYKVHHLTNTNTNPTNKIITPNITNP